jgi:hypothetical protein
MCVPFGVLRPAPRAGVRALELHKFNSTDAALVTSAPM